MKYVGQYNTITSCLYVACIEPKGLFQCQNGICFLDTIWISLMRHLDLLQY